ncbi:MAG: hypothetical protein KUG77_17950 [Nannocystaceae bacterium]|nr:hypothetical protein [Nannocystaceae bacterium]
MSLTCLVACDPILGGSSAGGSTSGSTGSITTADNGDSGTDPTHGPGGGSTSSRTTGAAPGETTGSSTSSTGSPTSSSAETGSSTTGGSSTTEASSSSTGEPPYLPDGVAPDWTLSLEGFDGSALEVLDDGRIAVGGQEGEVAMIHIVDSAGTLLSSHAIDPLLWDAAPASERVLELDRLDAQRLAVLVSRGADNEYSVYDGVLEFDVSPGSTGEIGWSALIEGVVLQDEPGLFEESVPGVTQQMITTSEGDIYVAGLAVTDQTTTKFPEYDGLVFWVQRLDPDSGASLWWHMRYLFDGFSNYDVVYWLFINDTLGRVLLQGNDWNKSSGNCFWRELTPELGEAVATDVSLGTDYEYCWRAAEFEDGRIGAPAGILVAGAHDVHIASVGGGVTEHLLDSTDFDDATRTYVDNNDRVFLEGRLQDYEADALGRVDLTDPASSEILVSWPAQPGLGESPPLRDVAFGPGEEVLVLREVGGTTVLEQRTLD